MADDSGKSGRDKGSDNVARLRGHLADLEASGRALPERGGKVNVSAIALACGFDRNVLYTNQAAKALLDSAVARMGLELPDQIRRGPLPADPGGPDPRDRRILQLEQANAVFKAENGALRTERNGLRERLRRFEHIEAHMVETGRRVAS